MTDEGKLNFVIMKSDCRILRIPVLYNFRIPHKLIVTVVVKKGDEKIIEKDGQLEVHTNVPLQNNMANRDVIRQVSEYYHVRSEQVKIIRGFKSRRKTIKVL